jgi:hypothetical protein
MLAMATGLFVVAGESSTLGDVAERLLHRSDGRVRVRRQQGERFREDCFVGTVMAGGGSVHVWGGINHGGKTAGLFVVAGESSTLGDVAERYHAEAEYFF